MTMKKDTKLEEKLTCTLKIYTRTLMNFEPSAQNLKDFYFNGLTTVYNV